MVDDSLIKSKDKSITGLSFVQNNNNVFMNKLLSFIQIDHNNISKGQLWYYDYFFGMIPSS